jgi:hypothetical protein
LTIPGIESVIKLLLNTGTFISSSLENEYTVSFNYAPILIESDDSLLEDNLFGIINGFGFGTLGSF